MKLNSFWMCLLMLFLSVCINAQSKKFDSTAKLGDQGYRVECNNKNADKNTVSVSPIGLKTDGPDPTFTVFGKVTKVFVDDLNEDGFPDLVLCIYNGPNGDLGNITAIASSGNNSLLPVRFPDIYSDLKLSEGYKGHDDFTVLVGTLIQSFPFYKPGDTDTPSGGTKVIQYKMVKAENGYTFKALRSYMK